MGNAIQIFKQQSTNYTNT